MLAVIRVRLLLCGARTVTLPDLRSERETGLEPADLLLGKQTLYQLSYSRANVILRGFLLDLRPAELFSSAPSMAIRTPHVALRDLTLKGGPRDMTDQP